jgi:hypothetical protein
VWTSGVVLNPKHLGRQDPYVVHGSSRFHLRGELQTQVGEYPSGPSPDYPDLPVIVQEVPDPLFVRGGFRVNLGNRG